MDRFANKGNTGTPQLPCHFRLTASVPPTITHRTQCLQEVRMNTSVTNQTTVNDARFYRIDATTNALSEACKQQVNLGIRIVFEGVQVLQHLSLAAFCWILNRLHTDLVVLTVPKRGSRNDDHQLASLGNSCTDTFVAHFAAQLDIVAQRIHDVRVHTFQDASRLAGDHWVRGQAHHDVARSEFRNIPGRLPGLAQHDNDGRIHIDGSLHRGARQRLPGRHVPEFLEDRRPH